MRPRWGFLCFRNRKSSNILQITILNASTCTVHAKTQRFSNNILEIEYQILVLAHTDLRKYEAMIGLLETTNRRSIQPICFCLQT